MTMRAGNLVIVMHGCLMYDNAYDPIFLVGIPSLEDARSKSVEKKRQTIRSVEPDALPLHLKLSPNRLSSPRSDGDNSRRDQDLMG